MNILINAYACSPSWGSEPGMAWNWIINLARHCRVFVITEGEWKDEILLALESLPQKDNIHFFFNPVSEKIRKMCWNQGDWRFYYFYRRWQKKTLEIAREICKKEKIDVLHQLNMIGFREPGYLWKIDDIPFVWGPIGGMGLMSTAYLSGTSLSIKAKTYLKNMINSYQARYSSRVIQALKKAAALVAAVKGVETFVKDYHKKDICLINETGCYCSTETKKKSGEKKKVFDILWVGKFYFSKQLGLAIASVAALKKGNIRLHIVGTGSDKEISYYKGIASSLGVEEQCVWHGRIPNKKVHEIMRNSDLFLFTSIMEGTPHVILEAIANNLPIVCFDICGQAASVNNKVGIKIPLSNKKQSIHDFAQAIKELSDDRTRLQEMSQNCLKRQQELSWESKAIKMIEIYNKVINNYIDLKD